MAALATDALTPRIARRFQLGDVAHAHALLGTPSMGGQAVIAIAEPVADDAAPIGFAP